MGTSSPKRFVPYAVLVAGLWVLLIGVQKLLSDVPDCGGEYMHPTDQCWETSVGPGDPTSNTYTADQEIEFGHRWGIGLIVIGGLLMIGAAIVIGRRLRRRPGRVRTKPAKASKVSTVTSRVVRAEADKRGLRVERFDSAHGKWEPHVRLPWAEIRRLSFATDPHDPVVGFYAVTQAGRRYLFDSAHLSDREWSRLATDVAAGSGGAITLDPTARSRV